TGRAHGLHPPPAKHQGEQEGFVLHGSAFGKNRIMLKAARKRPDVRIILSVMPSENAVCPILRLKNAV
ncbi:TPA: hypothetical protein ACKUKR_001477, partial [Neisseria gonorrhoeae]